MLQRHPLFAGLLIKDRRVSVAEGATLDILTRDANGVALFHQRAVGQQLRQRPLHTTILNRRTRLHALGNGLVRCKSFGNHGKLRGNSLEHAGRDASFHRVIIPRSGHPLPYTFERSMPGLHRLRLGALLRSVQRRKERLGLIVQFIRTDHALSDQLLGVPRRDRLGAAHSSVQERLCEVGLIRFVVPVLAPAPHIDKHVFAERAAPL